jgi:hypothetical protein
MLAASPLPRMVLRAVFALSESGSSVSMGAVQAVVPAPADAVAQTIAALDAAGLLDRQRMRLTMQGLAAACAPRMIATDRRRAPRDAHWAGAAAKQTRKPGLRKGAVVA